MFFALFSDVFVDCVYVVEQFVASLACGCACDEVWRQFLPALGQSVEVCFHVGGLLGFAQLVGFGEDDDEWHCVFAEEVDEVEVFGLWLVSDVDEQAEAGELAAL